MSNAAENGAPAEGKTTVEKGVNEQYDTDASMAFYEYVMGGGGDDIHYGIFNSDSDGLKESSQNSIEALAAMAVACGGLKKVSTSSASMFIARAAAVVGVTLPSRHRPALLCRRHGMVLRLRPGTAHVTCALTWKLKRCTWQR